MQTYEQMRAGAQDALAKGDAVEAFRTFRCALEFPATFDDTRFADALGVFAQMAEPLAGAPLAHAVGEAARSPRSPEALNALGYALYAQDLYGIAATILARAHEVAPSDKGILVELVAALEAHGRNDEALRALREATELVESDFLCRYLLAFNALVCGEIEVARSMRASLRGRTEQTEAILGDRIERILARADLLTGVSPLDRRDLRGWHFIINGGLLAHRSPHGFDEGMNGRYAFTQDSLGRCKLGLHRLGDVLEALGARPKRILMLPERGSEILAHAASKLLGLPISSWAESESQQGDLVIAYDLAALDEALLQELHDRTPGQILFAHAMCWTDPPFFAPDITTYLYQVNQSPWSERIGGDAAAGTVLTVPADTSPAPELADAVLAADESEEPDLPGDREAVLQFARAIGTAALVPGPREQHAGGSPVTSLRFL